MKIQWLSRWAMPLAAAVALVLVGCGEDATGGWEITPGGGGESSYGSGEDSVVIGGDDDG